MKSNGTVSYVAGISFDGKEPDAAGDWVIPYASLIDTIEILDLAGTRITDKAMPPIYEKSGLRSLFLSDTQLTDAGLTGVERLNELRILALHNCRITDASVERLLQLPKLEKLWLAGTGVSDEMMGRLRSAFPSLEIDSDKPTTDGGKSEVSQ